jgi:hypothetical protein
MLDDQFFCVGAASRETDTRFGMRHQLLVTERNRGKCQSSTRRSFLMPFLTFLRTTETATVVDVSLGTEPATARSLGGKHKKWIPTP